MKNWFYVEGNKEDFKDAPEWASARVKFNNNEYFVVSFEDLKAGDNYMNMNGDEGYLNPGMFKTSTYSFELVAKRVDLNDSNKFWDGYVELVPGMICKLNCSLPFYTPNGIYNANIGELVEVGGVVKFDNKETVVIRLLDQKYKIINSVDKLFLSEFKTEEQLKKVESKLYLSKILGISAESKEIEVLYEALKNKRIPNL